MMFDFMNTAGAAAREGRVRALAVTSLTRTAGDFGNLPPMADFIPGFELIGWQGIFASQGTPREIIERYNRAFNDILADGSVKEFFERGSLQISGGAPDVMAKRIDRDYQFFGRIAKEAKIQPE